MKKTSEELLDFFGLKIGDKIKVEGFINPFVIFEESGIQYVEEMSKDRICSTWDIIDFIRALLRTDYEIIKPKKKIGEMKCGEINCSECPFSTFCFCVSYPSGVTLSEIFETREKELKEKLNAIKAELEKEAEVE